MTPNTDTLPARLRDSENFDGMDLRIEAAQVIEALRMQVLYLQWSMEQAVDGIERGREFDALHALRRALESGRHQAADDA